MEVTAKILAGRAKSSSNSSKGRWLFQGRDFQNRLRNFAARPSALHGAIPVGVYNYKLYKILQSEDRENSPRRCPLIRLGGLLIAL